MTLTALAILTVGLICGLSWQMALGIGLSLALSSTAIVMQSLQEKNLTKTRGGRSAFSVLLFQDMAVIPILAVLPLLATLTPPAGDIQSHGQVGEGGFQQWLSLQPGWIHTLLVLGAVVSIIVSGRLIARPILRMVAKARAREAFVAFALLLVVGIALLMDSLGVSAALGTFLAGVVLANSEYRHELEADIEPFKGLLLGVFFISVGASIDFALVAAQPGIVAGIVFGLMILKGAILFVLAAFWKLKLDQRLLFSLSLAQGSEFAFVLLGFGINEGVLSDELAQLLIAGVALTMALTPLVMNFDERFLRKRFGTKETEEREADAMDEDAPVILAGMGRFGNFVARMLRSQGIEATVIDHDSDHIDLLRRIGIKAFYGDATRLDLLESAGAAKAKILIIAIDEEECVHRLIETARKHFPHLKIMVRALSMNHQHQLIEDGVEFAVHQHTASALQLAESAMVQLGHRAHQASRASKAFAKKEHERAHALAPIHRDQTVFLDTVREQVAEMERQFEQDRKESPGDAEKAWDTEQLRKDITGCRD